MTKNWRGWDILPYPWPKGDEPKERTVMSEKQEPTGSWPQYDPAAIKRKEGNMKHQQRIWYWCPLPEMPDETR